MAKLQTCDMIFRDLLTCDVIICQSSVDQTKKQAVPPFDILTVKSVDGTIKVSLINSTHMIIIDVNGFWASKNFLGPIFLPPLHFFFFAVMKIPNQIDCLVIHSFEDSNVMI